MTEQAVQKNFMRRIILDKVTVNIGLGESGERLQKAYQLLQDLTGAKPVYTKARKSIREFGVRKGAPIGVKVTLRGEKAVEFLKKALAAVNYRIKASSFDDYGNVGFGITEHVLIPGTRYDPEVGIFGMDVVLTLIRPGYRVMRRRRKYTRIPKRHRVTKEEAMEFLKQSFNVAIIEG
jgi:large subunit ribosomal protein L5